MVRKTYQCFNYTDYTTYVEVEGKRILIRFTGGKNLDEGNVEGGKYICTNPKIIKALDEAAGLNVNYVIISCEDLPDPAPVLAKDKPVKVKNFEQGTPTEPPEDLPRASHMEVNVTPEDSDLKLVPGITKVQDAKEYLLNLKLIGVSASKLTNGKEIKRIAAEHKISFPDLIVKE